MTPAALLADLHGRGIHLQAVEGKLRWDAPCGMMTPELIEALREYKAEIPATLAMKPAHRALQEAVETVSTRWNALPPNLRPDLDPAEDLRLEEQLNAAFRSRDAEAAHRAVGDWRQSWERLLPLEGGLP